jgi:hypothetical protein
LLNPSAGKAIEKPSADRSLSTAWYQKELAFSFCVAKPLTLLSKPQISDGSTLFHWLAYNRLQLFLRRTTRIAHVYFVMLAFPFEAVLCHEIMNYLYSLSFSGEGAYVHYLGGQTLMEFLEPHPSQRR